MKHALYATERADLTKVLIAAFVAAQLCMLASNPASLFSENIPLVRKGVMIDPSICACEGIGTGWRSFDTGYFKVSVDGEVDLRAVESQLSQRFDLLNPKTRQNAGIEDKVGELLDGICNRAMAILDMHPKMRRIEIRIFKSRSDLNYAYRSLTGSSGNIKAFHVNDCAMIYTCEDDMTDSVMAHEIAHAVVDSQYNGIPPTKVGEMMASYVDMHLAG